MRSNQTFCQSLAAERAGSLRPTRGWNKPSSLNVVSTTNGSSEKSAVVGASARTLHPRNKLAKFARAKVDESLRDSNPGHGVTGLLFAHPTDERPKRGVRATYLTLVDRQEAVVELQDRGVDGRCVDVSDLTFFPCTRCGLARDDLVRDLVDVFIPIGIAQPILHLG